MMFAIWSIITDLSTPQTSEVKDTVQKLPQMDIVSVAQSEILVEYYTRKLQKVTNYPLRIKLIYQILPATRYSSWVSNGSTYYCRLVYEHSCTI